MARRMVTWMRWEFSREIELTAGVRLIILDRLVKVVTLAVGGIVLLVAERTGWLSGFVADAQQDLNLNPGSSLWERAVNSVVHQFGSLSTSVQTIFAIAAILYGLLEAVEAFGLVRRRRWAEYLVFLATIAFIPVEIEELARHPSALKGLAFAINVVIAVYLVWRKKLFQPRPPSEGLRAPSAEPAAAVGG
ncbi:MAG: DUF2127 domain-containing protein [Candidatus Dormibacteraeota bacterium]|nr:DUF2127 domain-containing protein [Candidatus Dormibacteraeota bacterium]